MKSVTRHEFDDDIPIRWHENGERRISWIESQHYQKHIEIKGPTEIGKTTLLYNFVLGLLERRDAGILYIDPKGHGVKKFLGWLSDGTINRTSHLVDLDTYYPNYNPLYIEDEKTISGKMAGLYNALHLIQTTGESTTQHRQMRNFVIATLRALAESGLTLSDAFDWLKDSGIGPDKRKRAYYVDNKVRDDHTKKQWRPAPSPGDLKSTMNWFALFSENDALKSMYGGNGFRWDLVYQKQPMVLVSLNSRWLGNDPAFKRAVSALWIDGLLTYATQLPEQEHRLWYIIIDDATLYTPPHVAPILTEGRGYKVYLVLLHHQDFDNSSLQKSVDINCRTKFVFNAIPQEYQWKVDERYAVGRSVRTRQATAMTHLDPFQVLQVVNERPHQVFRVEPPWDHEGDVAHYTSQFSHDAWYRHEETKAGAAAREAAASHKRAPGPPTDTAG